MKKGQVELITTGTELLLGAVVNTNASWLGEKLTELGLRVTRQTTVPDGDAISDALTDSMSRHPDIIIISGGLGPTSDDVTRECVAQVCGLKLEYRADAEADLRQRFHDMGKVMTDNNLSQTYAPETSQLLKNEKGTAPGIWIPATDSRPHLFLVPGPPRELHWVYEQQIVPILHRELSLPEISVSTFTFFGASESALAEQVDDVLSSSGLEYGYCARIGEVDVRVVGPRQQVDEVLAEVKSLLPDFVCAQNHETLAEYTVNILESNKLVLTTAESCTGGMIATRITDVPGSSAVFKYGFVTYSNEAKVDMLGVDRQLIDSFGVVSEPVVIAMAQCALNKSGANIAVAVTGEAGPLASPDSQPVGTVWVAWAMSNGKTYAKCLHYPKLSRGDIRYRVSQEALIGICKLANGMNF